MSISIKLQWIRTDGWRGYLQPINAVCGANSTGSWDDSPCPTDVCLKEIKLAKSILRRNNIHHRTKWCASSNVFCQHLYVVTNTEDMTKAKELLNPIVNECRLLYIT